MPDNTATPRKVLKIRVTTMAGLNDAIRRLMEMRADYTNLFSRIEVRVILGAAAEESE